MEKIGWKALWVAIALAVVTVGLAFVSPWFLLLELIFVPLVLLGIYDITQKRHNILHNYPIALVQAGAHEPPVAECAIGLQGA